jgi:transposase-like protein
VKWKRQWKFDIPRKNRRTEKAVKQNVTARAKPGVSFFAICSEGCPTSSQLRARRFGFRAGRGASDGRCKQVLAGNQKRPQENKIAALERASRSFVIHRFQDCEGIELGRDG